MPARKDSDGFGGSGGGFFDSLFGGSIGDYFGINKGGSGGKPSNSGRTGTPSAGAVNTTSGYRDSETGSGRQNIVTIAQSQIGASESNHGDDKYLKWYGGLSMNEAWCAVFVSWCANKAGILGVSVPKFASCSYGGIPWFESRNKYHKSKAYGGTYTPRAGDVIFFRTIGSKYRSTHTGIVHSVSGANVYTIEGNTSNAVKKRSHRLSDQYVVGYGETNQSISAGTTIVQPEAASPSTAASPSASPSATEPETLDITQVKVVSTTGAQGLRKYSGLRGAPSVLSSGCEILIQNDQIYLPAIEGDITLEYERKGTPGALKFNVIKDDKLNIQEGNPVRFRVSGKNVFYGYIFTKSRKSSDIISITCYDQMRYLKNKDTISYGNKTYAALLKMLAKDYGLSVGAVEDTKYVIGNRIEETTLFDMLGNASDLTVLNTGKLYVLYDDFGELSLRNIESMILPILIDADTAGEYTYESTIDKEVYTRIKLASDNDKTGVREVHVMNGTENQERWGVLQYYEKAQDMSPAIIKAKSSTLLDYYNQKNRSLKLSKCFGDVRVRGGSAVIVRLNLGDILLQNYMVVEKVKHTFSNGEHFMDLDVSGVRGEFRG